MYAPVYDVTPLVMPIMLRTKWRNLHAEVKAPVPGQMKPPVSLMGMRTEPFPTTWARRGGGRRSPLPRSTMLGCHWRWSVTHIRHWRAAVALWSVTGCHALNVFYPLLRQPAAMHPMPILYSHLWLHACNFLLEILCGSIKLFVC